MTGTHADSLVQNRRTHMLHDVASLKHRQELLLQAEVPDSHGVEAIQANALHLNQVAV